MAQGSNSGHRIAAIVLAAGRSARFGAPKQLAAVDGEPLIARVVRRTAASGIDAVLVVLGHEFEKVNAALAGLAGIEVVNNPEYESGLSSSLKAGLARAGRFDAVMFVLGDLPGLNAADIDSVISAYRDSSAPLALGVHEGHPAHPVIFRKDLWPELEEVAGDTGGREVAGRHLAEAVTVKLRSESTFDIDTFEDYLGKRGESGREGDIQADCRTH